MKKTLLAILCLGNCWASGQNLVSNGSFVELDTCDFYGSLGNIRYVKDWHSTFYSQASSSPIDWHGSTDFFTNDCGNYSNGQVPKNVVGIQNPRLFKNYGGFWHAGGGFPAGWREGIQNHLVTELDSGGEYCFQAFISLADSILWGNSAASRLDVIVTDTMYTVPTYGPDTNAERTFQITNPDYFRDQVNWMRISGSFIANGGEQWLSITNLKHADSLDLFPLVPTPGTLLAYYYIDDVSLYPCNTPIYTADAGDDQMGCLGDTVAFSTPYRNEEYTYFWMDELGDTLSTSTTLTVEVSGNAEYYLAQWDFKYDLTWDTVRVILDYCPELELPNVFTPNGDSNNDFWKPIAEDIDQIEIIIYSRWGNQVFSYSGSYNDFGGWSPNEVPEGTYYVIVMATSPDGRTLQEKGSITLLR